jgi:glucosamine--fructose-6-phosphate aminotransferase (isomerizing)
MCGIYGIIGNQFKNNNKDIFTKLSNYSNRRGKEASGMFFFRGDGICDVLKSDVGSKPFSKSKDYQKIASKIFDNDLICAFGHSRIATHGTQLDFENNQPIISKNKNVFLVHNGIVVNHLKLKEKYLNLSDCYDSDTKVLAEILESVLFDKEYTEADFLIYLKQILNQIEGTYSLSIFFPSLAKVILTSNKGSLYYYYKKDSTYFASEKSFLIKSLNLSEEEKVFQIQPNELVQINTLKKINIESILVQNHNVNLNTKVSAHYCVNNDLELLRKHVINFDNIRNIKRCSKCILPITTPFIQFNDMGICNFCEEHNHIRFHGQEVLEKLVAKIKKSNNSPDCLAAFSGGRDSAFGLHFLKKELGLNPIAYTYDWGMVTDIARENQARILGKLGIEHIVVSADITQKRVDIKNNINAWLKKPHLGMVPLFMQGDKQCEFYADKIMKEYKINTMFFFRGNELEKEEFKNGHCGIKDADEGGVIHNLAFHKKLKLLAFYGLQYLQNPAYFNSSFFDTALAYFSTYIQKHNYIYIWHYIPWDEKKIISTLKNEYNWSTSEESISTWRTDDGSSAFYNYIYLTIQGFTENDSFRSRQIREGVLNREEALNIIYEENKPRYNALKWYFDAVGLNGNKVLTSIDNIKKLY